MPSFNQVVLMGNLTRDPELRYIPSGTAVCDVGLAVNSKVKKGDQWVDECDFFEITCWGKTAEVVCQYLTKGSAALFSGRLKLDSWEKDGEKRSKVKVVCHQMQMVGSKGDGGGGGGGGSSGGQQSNAYSQPAQQPQQQQQPPSAQAPASDPEDDIPF